MSKIPTTARSSIHPPLPCWRCSKVMIPACFELRRGEPWGRDWICKDCRGKSERILAVFADRPDEKLTMSTIRLLAHMQYEACESELLRLVQQNKLKVETKRAGKRIFKYYSISN